MAPTGAHPSLGDADGWSIFKGPPPAEAQGPAVRVLGVHPWRYGRKPHSCHPRETHFSTLWLRSSGHPQRRYVSPDGGEAATTSPYKRPHWFRTFRLGDWPPDPDVPRGARPVYRTQARCRCSPFPLAGGPITWLILPVTYACLKD